MKVSWGVRCFDRGRKALFDRELYLDTKTLDGATKEKIERELRQRNHQCVIPLRSLFQEVDEPSIDDLLPEPGEEMVGFVIPDYHEDEHGERITHIEMLRLATGDQTHISIPAHLTAESLQAELAQLTPDERQIFMQGLAEMQEATRRDLDRFYREIVAGPQPPIITLKSLIIPGDKTKEGRLIRAVGAAWFELVRFLIQNPHILHEIDCWKWEEIVAGAYKQAGWQNVILTPKRGDKGRDVIAEIAGIGELRHLGLGPLRYVDQVKAKLPTNQVGPDVVREMKGVLLDEQNATKAIITTTSTFSKGAIEAAAKFSPSRIELRDGAKLIDWLKSLLAMEDGSA